MRKQLIAGNWKMHNDVSDAQSLARHLCDRLSDVSFADVVICPPFVDVYPVSIILRQKESKILLGAQNMHPEPKGAFTGEISADMLISAGAKLVILGHSERRHIFNESDEFINRKVKSALAAGLVPILCIGELLEERNAQKTEDVLSNQLRGSLDGVSVNNPHSIIIAYEPVWAIGTGVNATPEQAQEAQKFIRQLLSDMWSGEIASEIRILYGGSVKPENAEALLSQPDVDGALVGGASLSAESFEKIVRCAKR